MSIIANIKYECVECHKEFDEDDAIISICEECQIIDQDETIREVVTEISKKDYLWCDKEGYVGFNNDHEKEIFLDGIRKGIQDALFFVCDMYGEIEFFEKIIFTMPEWKMKGKID